MTSIKSVADRAGVSITTVSHVINRPERVTPALRERVLRAIDELGYQASPTARSLRTGRTNLIALIISDICSPFWTEMAQAIEEVVEQDGYEILIYDTNVPSGKSGVRAQQYSHQLNRKRFDGAIITSEAVIGAEDILKRADLPAVYVGHLDEPLIDNVTIDDRAAAYDATSYLIDQGHQRIGHITGDVRFFNGRQRLLGYKNALMEHGLSTNDDLVFEGTYLSTSGYAGMKHLLSSVKPVSAVFVANGSMAIGALAAAFDMAARIPDDIAVVCIDKFSQMDDVRPLLTTIDYNPQVVGYQAATLLLERIRGEAPIEARSVHVPYSLYKGNTA